MDRQRKMERCARFRGLKNFLFFLAGMLIIPAIIAGVCAVVPLNVLVGTDEKVVSNKVASETVLNIALNYDKLTIGDITAIDDAVKGLNEDKMLKGLIKIDISSIKNTSFGNLGEATNNLGDCITITATLDSISTTFGVSLGKIAELDMFKNAEVVERPGDLTLVNTDLYYYKKADGTYAKAIVDGKYVAEAQDSSVQLYYPPISEIIITDAFAVLSGRLDTMKVTDLLDAFAEVDEDSLIAEILGDKRINEIGNITADDIKLSAVIDYDGNETLYNILCEATGYTGDRKNVTLGSLNNFDINKVKLSTVISSSGNKIVDALLEDDTVTLGNIGEKANGLKVSKIYDTKCFLEDASGNYYKVNDGYVLISNYSASTHGQRADNKKYKISSTASIWLFMFYDMTGMDTNGRAVKYTETNLTMEEMQSAVDGIALKVQGATIRQLAEAGIIADPGYTGATASTLYCRTLGAALSI